ncbi:type I phosphomannose isomerase catalytic subunit [Aquimarina hainanensis]|uniref:Phosphohexomutase n=1 Tax=Aquimarina hainanensis TaxID=1578017 RepID=A0ABW5N6I4_9FLAO|nr:type I phosphomannose isomerase catalytic subunit [Aquimarina sp. TRL1]
MEQKDQLDILKFTPILKEKIWGGEKLGNLLHKDSKSSSLGESWEISDVEGNYSIVAEGPFKGKNLRELQEQYKEQLVGEKNFKRFKTKFPLLIKFIDAKEALSVQLHPDDSIALKKHNSLGKTEMWYVMQADEQSNVIVGFNQDVDQALYKKHVDNKSIKEILNYEIVTPGDTFFVYAGLIHAIGKGVLLAEIQQTSDITYRIYDWDRADANGNYRELHQEEALEAIDYSTNKEYKVSYDKNQKGITDLVSCPHFITNVVAIEEKQKLSHEQLDSFVVYMCVEGEAMIKGLDISLTVRSGETLLVPATVKEIEVLTKGVKLLQTYI